MKEILQQYATYHSWANKRLIDCIVALPAPLHTREVPSSFPSLFGTLKHLWDAESVWWQRMRMQDVIVSPGQEFQGSMAELSLALQEQDQLWESWVCNATLAAIEHVFHYQNSKREQFKQPVWQVLLHIFNHGTYHRGQLVTMLRQLGIETIPNTDFIAWSRSLNRDFRR